MLGIGIIGIMNGIGIKIGKIVKLDLE